MDNTNIHENASQVVCKAQSDARQGMALYFADDSAHEHAVKFDRNLMIAMRKDSIEPDLYNCGRILHAVKKYIDLRDSDLRLLDMIEEAMVK